MRRLVCLLALSLLVVLWWKVSVQDQRTKAESAGISSLNVDGKGNTIGGTVPAPESALEESIELEQEEIGSLEQTAMAPVLPSQGSAGGLFPAAEVVAQMEEPEDDQGRFRVIKTLKTDLTEPYVRVIETYRRQSGLANQLEDQVAMIANQLLLQLPENAGEENFIHMIEKAGAIEVRKVGGGYLATFQVDPTNPNALVTVRERVREYLGDSVVIEPNFLRKLI